MINQTALAHQKVCIWKSVSMGGKTAEFFEDYMFNKFSIKAQFIEELIHGNFRDIIFKVKTHHLDSFEDRINYDIHLLEDIYWSNQGALYPKHVVKYLY